jgi:hypothetical protein
MAWAFECCPYGALMLARRAKTPIAQAEGLGTVRNNRKPQRGDTRFQFSENATT